MAKSDSKVELEALLAELQQKDNDLTLAGELGVSLVEKNSTLKSQLSSSEQEVIRLEESLESQRHSYMKMLHEAKKAAEFRISELTVELDSCRYKLECAVTEASVTRDEHGRSHKQLQEENTQLKEYLIETEKRYEFRIAEMNRKLEESDRMKWEVKVDSFQSQKVLEELQSERKSMKSNLSSMYRSCEKLSVELEDTKYESDYWEKQHRSKDEMLQCQSRELDDSKEMLDQLQRQLEIKESPMEQCGSALSSLFDELTSAQSFVQDSELSDEDKTLTLKTVHKVCETNWTDPACQRCQELQAQHENQQEEIERITDQLLVAVKHKIELQLQVEAWELDMAKMVDTRIKRKLQAQFFSNKFLSNKNGVKDDCGNCVLAYQILRNSWVF